MKCANCGHEMSEDSLFCMNCGFKVEAIEETKTYVVIEKSKETKGCKYCGEELIVGSTFCSQCGKKQKQGSFKLAILITSVLGLGILFAIIQTIGSESKIPGVSQKVYLQGFEYLDMMESNNVRDIVIEYALEHGEDSLNEIYENIDEVDFDLDLGIGATEEEKIYAEIIQKFWESWAICYAHESIIAEYEDSNDSVTQMAVSVYKGIVAEFMDGIIVARENLESAESIEDMQSVYVKLEDIWDGGE